MPSEVQDQRAANRLEPNEAVSEEELAKYGVLYWKLSGNADDSQLLKLKTDRGYDYTDCITCRWVHPGNVFARANLSCLLLQPGEAPRL